LTTINLFKPKFIQNYLAFIKNIRYFLLAFTNNINFYERFCLSFLFLIPFLLTACGPPRAFGLPQEQWAQLNQQQRSQVIEGYNQRTKAKAQIAPIFAIADALKTKKNSDATPNKPFDSFPDHNPMTDPDPEIANAFQPPSFHSVSLPGF